MWPWLGPPLTTMQSIVMCFRFCGWRHVSHNGACTVDRQQWTPVTPIWTISTRPQMTANNLIGWCGGRRHYGAGTKSAVSDCFVSSCDLELWHMTLTFVLDLDKWRWISVPDLRQRSLIFKSYYLNQFLYVDHYSGGLHLQQLTVTTAERIAANRRALVAKRLTILF